MTISHAALDASAANIPARPGTVAIVAHHRPLGYLRVWVTLLVIAHHAVLAYHPYAPPPAKSLDTLGWWAAFPVVDSQRWSGFLWFVGANETYFMALMFLLAGVFVSGSLARKGAGRYLRDRVLRLGVPFAVAAWVAAPLAYYPSYLQSGAGGGWAGFWQQWSRIGSWPAGPAWFVWVLLAFGAIAALLSAARPGWTDALGQRVSGLRSPRALFAALAGAATFAYLPLALAVDPMSWTTVGPFAFQTSRILMYFVYFLMGAGLGAAGLHRGLLEPGGALAKRWIAWLNIAGLTFAMSTAATLVALSVQPTTLVIQSAAAVTFCLAGAACSLAMLALFLRFGARRHALLEALIPLAFGMYLVHYPIVSWLQYALLSAALPGAVKGVLVFLGAATASAALVAMLRRIPAVARVI